MVTLNLAAPNPATVALPLSLANSFTDSLAALNAGVIADYLFGTSATGSAPVIPIRNLTDLATYFNPQADAVGTAVQNEEVERFAAFNTTNHAFNASDLSLTAVLEAGGTFTVVPKTLVGAITSSAVLSFADTTGVVDGMMFATSAGTGTPTTGIRVVSHDSTTVTLSSAFTLPNGASVEFIPVYPVTCNAVTAGSTLTVPAGLPSGIVAGMFYNNITNGTFGIVRVVTASGTTITLDGNVTITAGNLVFFSPPVTSAQIWSKAGYQPGKNNANALAFELTCTIPLGSACRGAWPAFWLYSKTSDGFGFDASEVDIFEFFDSLTASSNAYSSNIHGGAYNATRFQRSVGSGNSKWDASGFYRPGTDYGLAQHKFQLIWTRDKVYRFIDGQLIVVNDFLWSSNDSAQWSCDLACGSWIPAFMTIYFYPSSTGQFPFKFAINEVKIWQG
jgi:hypothetical protein